MTPVNTMCKQDENRPECLDMKQDKISWFAHLIRNRVRLQVQINQISPAHLHSITAFLFKIKVFCATYEYESSN